MFKFLNITADGVGIVRNFEELIKQNHTKPLGKNITKIAQSDLKITDFSSAQIKSVKVN